MLPSSQNEEKNQKYEAMGPPAARTPARSIMWPPTEETRPTGPGYEGFGGAGVSASQKDLADGTQVARPKDTAKMPRKQGYGGQNPPKSLFGAAGGGNEAGEARA